MVSSVRKWLIGAAAVIGVLLVVLLSVPMLIDVNVYRAQIVTQVKQQTDRDISLDGPISLWLLPTPAVRLEDVKVFTIVGAKNAYLAEIKSITVRPSLLALLAGRLQLGEVTLVEPKAFLEVDATGRRNWIFTAPADAAASAAAPQSLQGGRLVVENGSLTFDDAQSGQSMSVEKANIVASAASIEGPLSLAGDATVNGAALGIELALGAKAAAGHAAEITLQAGGGKLSFSGTLSELAPTAHAAGRVSASADNLVGFAETLIKAAGQPQPPLPALLAGKVVFEGNVELSQTAFASKDFKLVLGDDPAEGSLAVTLKPALAVDAKFSAKRLDLDRWLASIKLPDQQPALDAPPPLSAAPAAPATAGPNMLLSTEARAGIEVGELVYNKKPVRDISLDLEARSGAVAVPRFNALLPGDLSIKARSTLSEDRSRPSVAGTFNLSGSKLRETLTWLGVDVTAVPEGKLNRISMTGGLTSHDGNAEVKDAVFELDSLRGTGGIVVAFTVPLAVVTHLEFDTVDLDSYLPPGGLKPASGFASRGSSVPLLALLGPMVGLKLKVAKVAYTGDTIAGVELDMARDRGTLKLNDFKVANLVGARLAVRGAVANYWEQQPRADFIFSFQAPDMSRVLKLAGASQSGLGAVAASGGIAGTSEQLVLRDLAVSAMGTSASATGTLSLPGAAQGSLKSASYKGSLTVNGQTIEGSVEVNLTGRTNIVADLRTGPLDLDRIEPAGQRLTAAPSQPIDTTPLRNVDGTFRFLASSLSAGQLRLANLEVAATLKDGILTLSALKGSLYGGTLSLSGAVNAMGPMLSFNIGGDAQGMHVGELLRATSGTNVFGSVINVAIDGSLNANGIVVRGQGTTAAEIRSSLAGAARLSGGIRASADRFLQILGSAATGAVGGAIDATLGNIMSLAGEKGGVDIANLLNAISLVLHRFVNNDNALVGQLDIAGGILTANGLVVQGSGATANIATHTNLANATTQTTINFVIAEDPSGPYLITTVNGPLSALSFHATRGSAKDPPGIEKLVPNISRLLPSSPSSLLPSISVPQVPVPSIPNPFR
jgi:uncharacterized protein involved in outer membrane biogenesis